ncbi:MAG: YdeI/OmpD-associated family protein [Leptospiraceae bacterium]|nr:YdeI/OmpD-associated family protein [Leptospiraceae bacterium]
MELPAQLQEVLNQDAEYKQVFEALKPGRQRSYVLHFNSAKQAQTRLQRMCNCRDRVLDGKGFH